jgi:hypothetical protein
LSTTDPTDHALAAIASILDYAQEAPHETALAPEENPAIGLTEADGYHRVGPGPLAAIRFKWTVRRADDGQYYVEEKIGDQSRPLVTGPMSAGAAIRMVDSREEQTRSSYDRLRSEMSGKNGSAASVRSDSNPV